MAPTTCDICGHPMEEDDLFTEVDNAVRNSVGAMFHPEKTLEGTSTAVCTNCGRYLTKKMVLLKDILETKPRGTADVVVDAE